MDLPCLVIYALLYSALQLLTTEELHLQAVSPAYSWLTLLTVFVNSALWSS